MKIKTYIGILCLILIFNFCKSRVTVPRKYDYSYEDKWKFFKSDDTISITIIKHLKAEGLCGTAPFASKTIGLLNNDTIRVINICNMENYRHGEIVKFIPLEIPNYRAIVPHSKIYNQIEDKFLGDHYDFNVINTTYGVAIR